MNLIHNHLCQSARWKGVVGDHILPWALKDVNLGENVLEIGPGFGVTTDFIHSRTAHLTCVEVNPKLAESLGRRMEGRNVTVQCEDATAMSAPDASFDSVVCFTMLHHVPSAALQDRLMAEAARVLRPGGVFVGTDSVYSFRFRLLHLFDTMVVVNPETLPDRLRRAGFADVEIETNPFAFKFRARKADGGVN